MKVISFSGHGVKGRNFQHTLTPVTVFYGRNFAGKTARLEALQLALAGFLPGYPRRPGELLEALGGQGCRKMEVEVVTDHGTYTRAFERNPSGSVSVDECDWKVPAAAVDPQEWLGLSAKERVRYLFSAMDLSGKFKKDELVKRVASKPVVADALNNLKASNLQDWVEEAAVMCKERKLAAVASGRRLRATVAGVAQVKEVPGESEARSAATLKAAEDEERKRADELGDASRAVDAAEGAVAKAEDAKTRLAEAGPDAVQALADDMDRHAMEEPKYDRAEHGQAELALKASRDALARVETKHASAARAYDAIVAQLLAARGKKCKTCGHTTPKDESKIKALEPQLKTASNLLARFSAAMADLNEALDNDAVTVQRCAGRQAQRVVWLGKKTELAERKAELASKATEAASLRDMVSTLSQAETDLAVAKAKSVEALKAWEATEVYLGDCKSVHERALRVKAEVGAQAKAVTAATEAEEEADAFGTACTGLLGVQRELVHAAVGPLLASANRLCEGLLKFPLHIVGGAFGMVDPAKEVFYPHSSFSGTEKALAYCALCVALATQSGDGPRVAFIDEVGRLDNVNQQELAHRLVRLCEAGELDNAVLTCTDRIDVNLRLMEQVEVAK